MEEATVPLSGVFRAALTKGCSRSVLLKFMLQSSHESTSQPLPQTSNDMNDSRLEKGLVALTSWSDLPPTFVALLDALPEMLFIKDKHSRYLFINQAGEQVFRIPREAIIGHSEHDFLPEHQAGTFTSIDRVAMTVTTPTTIQQSFYNGESMETYQVRLIPLRDESGEVWGLLGTARNVTKPDVLDSYVLDAASRLRDLAEGNLMGVMVAEPNGRILEANDAALRILGRGRDDLEAGKLIWEDLVCTYCLENHQRAMQQLVESGVALPWETEFIRPDAQRAFLLSGAVLMGDKNHCLAYIIDLESRQRSQTQRENQLLNERDARLEAEMTVMRLEAILAVTDTALTHLDSDHLLDELLERICTLLQADSAALWMMEPDGRHLAVRAIHGVGAQFLPRERVAVGEGLIGGVAQQCEPIAQEDALQTETANMFTNDQLRASVGVPLVVNERVTGVLHVGSAAPRLFSSDAVHLLQLVADRAANAIERAQLFNQVRLGKQQLDEMSRRLLRIQENERRHVARELHDEIGQVLTAVKISLQSVGRSLGEPSPDQQATISESVSAVESAIASVRDLSLDLRPPMLDELGLIPTLRWFANRQTKAGAFQCLLDAAATPRLVPDIEIACFRVAQEAITNAARHANAANVNIKLQTRNGLLQLTVSDDGDGFDTDARARDERGQSLGLLNMEERVRLAGGLFSIKSKLGAGTTVQALFPLPNDMGRTDDAIPMTSLSNTPLPSAATASGGESF
jgi:PAS domain S-box-containing protein